MKLLPRFTEALASAKDHHNSQKQKGTDIPHVSQPIRAGIIVLENGGTEAIAALHLDAIEAQGDIA